MAKVAPVAPPTWIPEDDLLLKTSIEAGASLEALAKGAVNFSRRFTFRELRDRWYSILYDSDVSAQASLHMVELELSGSNPSSKFSRLYSKGNEKVSEKRKSGSIRGQYYARRKRIRSEFYDSRDLGFLGEPNLPNYNEHGHGFQEHATINNEDQHRDSVIGDCLPNNLGLQETDLEILRQAFPETIGDICVTGALDNAANGLRTGCQNAVEDDISIKNVRKDGLCGSFELKKEPIDSSHILSGGSIGYGKCMSLREIGPSQTSDAKLFEDESRAKQISNLDSMNDNNRILCSGFSGKQHFSSPGSDGSASFHTMGFSSPLPRMPLWKTMEDVSAPDMPVDENNGDRPHDVEEMLTLADDSDHRRETTTGYVAIHSEPLLRDRPDDNNFVNQNVVSEGEFTDLPDSLLNFSNEDELLFMDVDVKDAIMDKSCYDQLNSILLGSPKEVLDGDFCKVDPKKSSVSNDCLAAPGVLCPAESEDITSSLQVERQSDYHVEVDAASKSVLNSESLQLNEGKINCILNTEDPDIPCNDDIFLLIHPGTSFVSSARQPITADPINPVSSSADEKDAEQGVNLMKKGKDPASSFTWSQTGGPNVLAESVSGHPLVVCTAKPELPDTKSPALCLGQPNKSINDPYSSRSVHAALMTTVDGVLEEDLTKVEPRTLGTPGINNEMPLHVAAGCVKLTVPESMANPSTSDQDECESEGDMPYFSDVEAMILEMDLAHDQDSCISRQVSRYQSDDAKRTIIKLEQTARSSLQRAMSSKGAFAILSGRRSMHYIKKTEVTLGRSTEGTDIDIDLRKEGRADKISRRQATIKMESDGSFILKNLGKSSILVNGNALANGQELTLSSSCLIEIRGMSFLFEINHKYVTRYLDNLIKQSQAKKSNVAWSPEVEPSRVAL